MKCIYLFLAGTFVFGPSLRADNFQNCGSEQCGRKQRDQEGKKEAEFNEFTSDGLEYRMPIVPDCKFVIMHGNPLVNYQLDKNSPEMLMVYVKDAEGRQVSWGRVLRRGEYEVFPLAEVIQYKPPFHVSVASPEFGAQRKSFEPINRGDAVAVWHTGNTLWGYKYFCYGSKNCQNASRNDFKALINSVNLQAIQVPKMETITKKDAAGYSPFCPCSTKIKKEQTIDLVGPDIIPEVYNV